VSGSTPLHSKRSSPSRRGVREGTEGRDRTPRDWRQPWPGVRGGCDEMVCVGPAPTARRKPSIWSGPCGSGRWRWPGHRGVGTIGCIHDAVDGVTPSMLCWPPSWRGAAPSPDLPRVPDQGPRRSGWSWESGVRPRLPLRPFARPCNGGVRPAGRAGRTARADLVVTPGGWTTRATSVVRACRTDDHPLLHVDRESAPLSRLGASLSFSGVVTSERRAGEGGGVLCPSTAAGRDDTPFLAPCSRGTQ